MERPAEWLARHGDGHSYTSYRANPDKYALAECIQYPGEVMFVPSGYSHATLNLDDTVNVAAEFCDADWDVDPLGMSFFGPDAATRAHNLESPVDEVPLGAAHTSSLFDS